MINENRLNKKFAPNPVKFAANIESIRSSNQDMRLKITNLSRMVRNCGMCPPGYQCTGKKVSKYDCDTCWKEFIG